MSEQRFPEAATEASQAQVLIVEDDFALRQTYQDILSLTGFRVECVATGPEAMRVLPRLKPSVVILDMNLPGGYSGAVVLAFIRSQPTLKDTYVIVASGQPEAEMTAEYMRADQFLSKPVSVQDLIGSVRMARRNTPNQG
jgi:DNA-binding response OmpR family regulator